MKVFYLLIFNALFILTDSISQAPGIEWQKCYGGSNGESFSASIATENGGAILVGASNSNDGDVNGGHGQGDFWVVKIDSSGAIKWQHCYGGSDIDVAFAVNNSFDGGYIVAGETLSSDSDVTGYHGNADFWVIKIDSIGNLIWQKCLGGSNMEFAKSVALKSDSTYIIGGVSMSNDGDVTGLHGSGNFDYWIINLDNAGNLLWQRCFGGTGPEMKGTANVTYDGKIVAFGQAGSLDGDVTGFIGGGGDYWIMKTDTSNTILSQKCLGGTSADQGYYFQPTSDSGYILAGYSNSTDGDVTGVHSFYGDYWIVKLDSSFNIIWQNCFGGTGLDVPASIIETSDNGYIVNGYTESNDGNVTGNHSTLQDFWILKLDSSGNFQWQIALGGSDNELGNSVCQTTDSGFIVTGSTFSIDGDLLNSGYHGNGDAWVVKLAQLPNDVPKLGAPLTNLTGFITSSILHLNYSVTTEHILPLQIFDITGRLLFEKTIKTVVGKNDIVLPVGEIKAGVYILSMGKEAFKVIAN